MNNRYIFNSKNYIRIPGCPFAYWVSESFIKPFDVGKTLGDVASVPKGLSTGDVDRFMRFWYEIDFSSIGFECVSCLDSKETKLKWFPYAKGGQFRRWNGNLYHVVNWQNDGEEVKNFVDSKGKQRSRPQNTQFYFKECATYSAITSNKYAVRYLNNSIFGGGGDSIHYSGKIFEIMGFLNSVVAQKYLNVISPTLNFEVDHIKRLPVIETSNNKIDELVKMNIEESKEDWDSFEESWNFKKHPLV